MRNAETINREIDELKKRMSSVKGSETEVYTRIVGYYRSVNNWNKGKRDEYNKRKLFSQPGRVSMREAADSAVSTSTYTEFTGRIPSSIIPDSSLPAKYLYFYRTTCPNCPPVKNWLENFLIDGEAVNVDEKEGFTLAAAHKIFVSPTVVFLDNEGKETSRATSVKALDTLFDKIPV